jgi:hypothetical protein
LIDIEDAEDSGDDQEVAVAEWTRGANSVSCKWVKQQGPTKGFDFDVSKVEQIFDLLLKEKQLKLSEGFKLPIAQELHGRSYCHDPIGYRARPIDPGSNCHEGRYPAFPKCEYGGGL